MSRSGKRRTFVAYDGMAPFNRLAYRVIFMPESVRRQIDTNNLHGLRVDDADPVLLREAINHALNYRGDVTVHLRTVDEPVTGYLFDQRKDRNGNVTLIRVLEPGAEDPLAIAFTDIAELHITGRDTAAGKSWETWVRRYIERKTAELNAAGHAAE